MSRKRGGTKLASVRRRIDRLDAQLLRFVNQRARLALEIGRIKQRRKWPVFDPQRKRLSFGMSHGTIAGRSPRAP